jgi:hypothetical protein
MVASSIATSTRKWTCDQASAYRQARPETLHRCASLKAPAAEPGVEADAGPWLQCMQKHPRSPARLNLVLGGSPLQLLRVGMYSGPAIDDPEILDLLPSELRRLLSEVNGYVAYNGGFHLRGACTAPDWHSLRAAWSGPDAIHTLYSAVEPKDVPFGEDALGDQYLIRDGVVSRLLAETGELTSLDMDLYEFDRLVRADPKGFLSLEPLEAFRVSGQVLKPGQLLHVYPPFIVQKAGAAVSYRAIPVLKQRRWLASLARQIADLPDGTRIRLLPVP